MGVFSYNADQLGVMRRFCVLAWPGMCRWVTTDVYLQGWSQCRTEDVRVGHIATGGDTKAHLTVTAKQSAAEYQVVAFQPACYGQGHNESDIHRSKFFPGLTGLLL